MTETTQDMSTLEKREEWYQNHECHPTSLKIADTLERVQWLQAEYQADPFRRVLDIGCHDGFSTRWLLRTQHLSYLLGVDLCESAIATARTLAKGAPHPDRADYRELNFKEIPHKPGRFDVVVGFELIEHLENEDAREFLQIMHKHLCPGGRAFVTTPHIDGPYGRSNPDPAHINLFTASRLAAMIESELDVLPLVLEVSGAIWAAWNKK